MQNLPPERFFSNPRVVQHYHIPHCAYDGRKRGRTQWPKYGVFTPDPHAGDTLLYGHSFVSWHYTACPGCEPPENIEERHARSKMLFATFYSQSLKERPGLIRFHSPYNAVMTIISVAMMKSGKDSQVSAHAPLLTLYRIPLSSPGYKHLTRWLTTSYLGKDWWLGCLDVGPQVQLLTHIQPVMFV